MRFSISTGLLCLLSVVSLEAASPQSSKRTPQQVEAATKLQVILDRANFGPGKLDGHFGEFTKQALALYMESKGIGGSAATLEQALALPGLETVNPVYITYRVTDADVSAAWSFPAKPADQAGLQWLPYRTVAEGVAEKFHSDADFLEELNPGKTAKLKAGDEITVPNVEAFDITTVKGLRPGYALPSVPEGEPKPAMSVEVRKDTNMLIVRENERVVAAFPVTVGSSETASPMGDWTVKGVAKLPEFRWDEKMLKQGERSESFHMLPPGPNNPVGVAWIQLSKKGIGLHGTSDPDAIGRNASHGCIRLANWDVVKLIGLVKFATPVRIHE